MITGGDTAIVVAAIEAIEAFGFKSRPDGEVWCKAEIIRCGFLLDEAVRLKSASQWQEVLAKIDFVQRLQNELKLELPSAALKQLEVLESWARGEHEKDRKDHEFSALISSPMTFSMMDTSVDFPPPDTPVTQVKHPSGKPAVMS